MLRLIVCGLMLTAFAGAARAGELDRETGPATPAPAKSELAPAVAGSELDGESPAQSHYWRRGWYGWGGAWGWGGYSPARVSYGWGGWGWGGYPAYSSWGWGGYPAYSSWGWGGYYPGFYPYRGWYGGFYPAYSSFGWGGWW